MPTQDPVDFSEDGGMTPSDDGGMTFGSGDLPTSTSLPVLLCTLRQQGIA